MLLAYRKQNEEVLLVPKGLGLRRDGFVTLLQVMGLPRLQKKVAYTVGSGTGIPNKHHKESAQAFFTTFDQALLDKVITIKEQQKLWTL